MWTTVIEICVLAGTCGLELQFVDIPGSRYTGEIARGDKLRDPTLELLLCSVLPIPKIVGWVTTA